MYISKIDIKNFRLLKDTSLDVRKSLSLLLGRNNCGKTSLVVLFEKFFGQGNFQYTDFPIILRKELKDVTDDTDTSKLAIRLILNIEYDEKDNLERLSEFILDLDPSVTTAKILFECGLDKKSYLKAISAIDDKDKEKFIRNNITKFLYKEVYAFSDDNDLLNENRHKLIKKEISDVRELINLQIVHAKRNVSSSEESLNGKKTLSNLTTSFFNNENPEQNADLAKINEHIGQIDDTLNKDYEAIFKNFLANSKKFLQLEDLKVVSNIQSKDLLSHSSEVIYGSLEKSLPEHLNGLGFMNILYLLLTIDIKKANFKKENKDINLLFIEEPEAHTHPQMQYVFAETIHEVLNEVEKLQTVITTHSSHIVSQSDFEDIRYLQVIDEQQNIKIKNFHNELKKKYTNLEQFKFLEQYLNIQSAELFFASKVIFIEGITERMLLPYFIEKFDAKNSGNPNYVPIASQNITILEVGANAKAFDPFLEFLDIQTLVLTDLDTTKLEGTSYTKQSVADGTHTSNETLSHFFSAPAHTDVAYTDWFKKLKEHKLESKNKIIKLMYQKTEDGYQARSFEDAFIKKNLAKMKTHKDNIFGLQKKNTIDTNADIYSLTNDIILKKSDFAASLLYLALSKDDAQWEAPSYVQEGLDWISKK